MHALQDMAAAALQSGDVPVTDTDVQEKSISVIDRHHAGIAAAARSLGPTGSRDTNMAVQHPGGAAVVTSEVY